MEAIVAPLSVDNYWHVAILRLPENGGAGRRGPALSPSLRSNLLKKNRLTLGYDREFRSGRPWKCKKSTTAEMANPVRSAHTAP
jgi:hypothetical protein